MRFSAVVALVLGAACAAGAQERDPPPLPQEIGGEDLSALLERWPREYVRWIMTDEERKRYKNLVTDEQRIGFVEGFWRRRDPSAGTPDNEYRSQYLECYAFVARAFSAGRPGWSTDRGRIYLILGPPHSIERNPMGRYGLERPSEIWTFNNLGIPGVPASLDVTFVDFKGTGDFEIVSDLDSTAAIVNELGFAESNLLALAMRRAEPREDLGMVDPRTGFNRVRDVDTTHLMMRELDLQQQLRAIEDPSRSITLEEVVEARASFDRLLVLASAGVVYSGTEVRVSVSFGVPYRVLSIERAGDQVQYRLDYLVRLMNEEDVEVARREDALTIRLPADQEAQSKRRMLNLEESLAVEPGRYRLQVLVRDLSRETFGLVERDLEVAPARSVGLSLSSLFIAGAIIKGASLATSRPFQFGPVRVVPSLDGRFGQDQSMGFYLEAYGTQNDVDGRKRIKVEIFVMRDDRLFMGIPINYLRPDAEPVGISAMIPLRKCPPGDYALRVRVTDQVTGERLEKESPFTVRGE